MRSSASRLDPVARGRVPPAGGVYARVDYQGVDGYPFLEDNQRRQAAYHLLAARVGWERGRFGIALWARNLLGQTYFPIAVRALLTPGYIGLVGDPRTFGVAVTMRL
jgi:hypothetical protein